MALSGGVLAAVLSLVAAIAQAGETDPGKAVFMETAEPQCALCHTLADAGSTAEVGPNLDELKPDAARIRAAVTSGIGVMPAYGELLTAGQIDAVTEYVAGAVAN